jgi:hypothetical protein
LRAKWLVTHTPRVVAPDSALVAVFHLSADTGALGRVPLRVNGRALDAVVTAKIQGIVIADTSAVARLLRTFPASGGRVVRSPTLAVADSVALGRLAMTNVPVTIARLDGGEAAMIGLDALGRFAPTFDPVAGRITLRSNGTVSGLTGDRLDTWMTPSDVRVAQAGGWISISRPQIAQLLRTHRWTLDAKRGVLVVAP